MAKKAEFRVEHDTMGEVLVPIDALYAAQTQRAVENFPISGTPLESAHIAALAQIKKSAALANAQLGVLPKGIADAMAAATIWRRRRRAVRGCSIPAIKTTNNPPPTMKRIAA